MSEPEQSQAAPPPPAPDGRAGIDLVWLERTLSRGVAVVGLAVLILVMAFSEDHKASAAVPLAVVGVFLLAKLVVLALGVRQRWPAWPAVALEIAALSVVAYVVQARTLATLTVVLVAVLLVGAGVWRRRVSLQNT